MTQPDTEPEIPGSRGGRLSSITRESLEQALYDQAGIITCVARQLGVSRSSVYRAIERYGMQSVQEDAKAIVHDEAIESLRELVARRHPIASIYVAKAARQNWQDRPSSQEIRHKHELAVKIDPAQISSEMRDQLLALADGRDEVLVVEGGRLDED